MSLEKYLKGNSCFEPVVPHQSTVVFAVLIGQVSDGGCDAGAQELLSLVQVALVDLVQKLLVPAHISQRTDELISNKTE